MEYNLIKLNTARNSLRYIIRTFDIREIYIPYYICPCIRTAVLKENCKIKFYHIDINFYPLCDFPENSYILYPNYFGICNKNVDKLAATYKNLIVDNAHSFYSHPQGIASFNSLRKFFPFLADGSFLYIKDENLPKFNKDDYVYEITNFSYEEICKNENRLDYEDIKIISDCTLFAYENINIELEKKKRIQMFEFWQKRLKDKNLRNFIPGETEIPFCYPYLAKTSEEADVFVKKYKNLPIYRYWNNLPDNFPEKIFYTNLVCIN